MYLRTYTRTNKNGTVAQYYQLAHNERHPKTKKPFPRIIYNFGRADELDRYVLVRLCKSIARVCNIEVTDPLDVSSRAVINNSPNTCRNKPDEVNLNNPVTAGKPTYEELEQRLRSSEEQVAMLQKTNHDLKDSEEKYKTIFENANDLIVYTDVNGRFVDVNNRSYDLYGFNREDCIGKHFSEIGFIDPEETKRCQALFLDMLTEDSISKIGINALTIDKKPVFVEINSKLIKEDGTIKGILTIMRDITERRQAEEKLQQYHGRLKDIVKERTIELEEANAALKVLLKRREQDKTELEERILTNIKELVLGFLEKLKESNPNDIQKAYIDIIEYNLNDIITPFVQTLSSGYLNLTPTEIRIANLIKQDKTTKDIAEMLKMSSRTIDNHRYSIRKKLKLNNTKTNLTSHLLSFK
jgi:PAS domain S-box-containing protein